MPENRYHGTMASTRSLADLAPGDSAVVETMELQGSMRRRLLELGLLPGTKVTIVRVAPLGDPLELEVRRSSISIRRADAQAVRVKAHSAPVLHGQLQGQTGRDRAEVPAE